MWRVRRSKGNIAAAAAAADPAPTQTKRNERRVPSLNLNDIKQSNSNGESQTRQRKRYRENSHLYFSSLFTHCAVLFIGRRAECIPLLLLFFGARIFGAASIEKRFKCDHSVSRAPAVSLPLNLTLKQTQFRICSRFCVLFFVSCLIHRVLSPFSFQLCGRHSHSCTQSQPIESQTYWVHASCGLVQS